MWKPIVREIYRRERIPALARWALAADGMHTWFAMLRRGLAGPLGGRAAAERELARAVALAYERRWSLLRAAHPSLPDDPGARARVMGALLLIARHRRGAWALSELGGPLPLGAATHLRAEWALRRVPAEARWREVTTHLGEVLIQLTRELPRALPGMANAVLGRICFEGGARAAERAKRAFALPDGPASAIEVLRMSEYVFRVNPEHWEHADAPARTGMIEGTACPWFTAPGWSMMHCGIFGQFQSGIASVFGLRYQLTTTIPKHGGHTCRIDLHPIKRRDGTAIA